MLGSSSSGDLENAAWEQQNADYYRDQQAQDIAAGDYEAAKEDAQNVGAHTGDADYLAGGDDHTGQADKDVANLDWAVWDEKNADSARDNADYYAAQGDFDHAQEAADQADSYDATAGDYADHADPTSVGYDYDPSSAVDSGGSYVAGYDATAIDSGFDAGVDTSAATSYDPGTDDM
jgi:tetratricopeptide (TPR) repeat protein